ncbi:hypothetical protein [Thermaurantimonas sp.]|uniref:hypothetical protein n=1 Tax=Thermaurantimonas sp. TaxID=2681568 RepID=UPI00391C252B
MKKTLFLLGFIHVFTTIYSSLNAQNKSSESSAYTFENAVSFLSLHTGIPKEAFDEKSFKNYENIAISGVKISGMYVTARSEQLGGFYDFFIRIDRPEMAGQYRVYPITACFGKKATGIQNFLVKNDECLCNVVNNNNFQMKARDVNVVFK